MIARYRFASRFLVLLGALLITCASCKHVESEDIQKVTAEFEKRFEKAKGDVSSLTSHGQNLTTEELEKLFTFEYAIVDIPYGSSREEQEAKLSAMGKERWEAFHIDTEGQTRIYFKRRPQTYLRYIPRFFP